MTRRYSRSTMLSRRAVLGASLVSPLAVAVPSFAESLRPSGAKRPRITKVHTVEIRGVPAGTGLVPPWDAKKTPLDTRDYVVAQVVTDQGLIGTTMDGDYRLPDGIGRLVQERAEAYFVAPKVPGLGAPWSREFFAKHKLYWEA